MTLNSASTCGGTETHLFLHFRHLFARPIGLRDEQVTDSPPEPPQAVTEFPGIGSSAHSPRFPTGQPRPQPPHAWWLVTAIGLHSPLGASVFAAESLLQPMSAP